MRNPAVRLPVPGLLLRAAGAASRFVDFLVDLVRAREVIFAITRRDFAGRYFGSYLGLLWAFVHPIASILVIWFVFQVGFKAAPVHELPFILWLAAGMIPWNFFAEAVTRASNSVVDQSRVVKQVRFRASVLPIVPILSALVVHVTFIGVLLAMFAFYRVSLPWTTLQLPYYLGAMVVLLVGVSWLTASLTVFLRDVPQMISLAVQFGFWATPVFWSIEQMPERFRGWLALNPLCYLVEGYRHSLIDGTWFWQTPKAMLGFWLFTAATFVVGAAIFSRLRPHFADAL